MSVQTSASISQSGDGSTLTFTDTSSGLVAPITRSLTIYDPNGVPLASPPFSGVSATYTISADAWFSFVETITDANGTYSQTLNYESTVFYENAFANAIAALPSVDDDLFGVLNNLTLAQANYQASLRMFIGGFGVVAQQLIQLANYYINTPYYAI